MTTQAPLQTKAVIARVRISQWTGRKLDRKTTQEIEARHAAHDAGRYNKILIAQEAIKAVQQKATAARQYHYSRTLPWNDNGDRILPTAMYLEYMAAMRTYKNEFETAAQELIDNYPALRNEAAQRLNTLFNPEDYPDPQTIADKYRFDTTIETIPGTPDPRLEVPDLDALTRTIEAATEARLQAAQRDLWQRLYKTVAHAADTLADPDKNKFHNALITNIEEVLDVLPALNITNDPALEAAAQEVRRKITCHSADSLKNGGIFRQQVAADAAAILATIGEFYGG